MRKITRDSVNAFKNNETFCSGSTKVISGGGGSVLTLYGNPIAMKYGDGHFVVSSAGWETATTKDRLNGILSAMGCQGIYQRDSTWYWDDGTEFGEGWQVARE